MLKFSPLRPARRRALGIAAAVALGTVAMTLGSAAQAATPTGAGSTSSHAVTALARTASAPIMIRGRTFTITRPNSADTTNCTITADNPFMYSGEPYGEGVEGLASVSCTGYVYAIEVDAEIYNDNLGEAWWSGWDVDYDAIEYGNNAEAPLNSGYWQACGYAYIWWTSSSESPEIGYCTGETWIS